MAEAPASRSVLLTTAERLIYSPYNYWFAMVTDLAAAVALFFVVIRHRSTSWALPAAFITIGFMAWGLLEYVLHRWVLHGRPSMARRSHARHHADDTALLSTPGLVAIAAACGLWTMLSKVFRTEVASQLVFGLYVGYNHYALVHHWQHRQHTALTYVRTLERVHRTHHAQHTVNYGVTTTLWDRLLGTFQRSPESGHVA